MASYTITLSPAEEKALLTAVLDIQEYFDNFARERCRVEIDRIFVEEVNRKIAAGEPIVGTKEDIVLAANVKTVAEIKAEAEARQKEV